MDTTTVLSTFAGAFAGSALTLLGILLKSWLDDRKNFHKLFEEKYITNGINRLLSHTNLLISALLIPRQRITLCSTPLPFEAIVNIEEIIDEALTVLLSKIQNHFLSSKKQMDAEGVKDLSRYILNLSGLQVDLKNLRDFLLSIPVDEKKNVGNLKDLDEIKEIRKRMMKFMKSVSQDKNQ